MENKKPWLSKSIWAGVLLALSSFYPPIGSWVAANPAIVLQALGLIAIGLRLVTKSKVSMTD